MGGGASKQEGAPSIAKLYQFREAIGKGSFATVYEAELLEEGRKTSRGELIPKNVAIKAIDKSKIPQEEIPLLQEECRIMEKLSHPNCVGLLEFFDEADFLYLVLELVSGGELFDQIVAKGYFNEVEAAHATQKIAMALAYMEDKRIVHRDVKPENLIFESNDVDANIKLTDFGLAKDISGCADDCPLTDPCGTPGYVAPEILRGLPYGGKVDSWALGVILYILLCGYPPFYAEDQQDLFSLIKRGEYKFDSPYWDDVSDAAKSVVVKLLQVDPAKRLTAKQTLLEPWVADPEAQNSKNFGNHVIEGFEKIRKEKVKRAILKIRAMTRFGALSEAARSFTTAPAAAESHATAAAAAAAAGDDAAGPAAPQDAAGDASGAEASEVGGGDDDAVAQISQGGVAVGTNGDEGAARDAPGGKEAQAESTPEASSSS